MVVKVNKVITDKKTIGKVSIASLKIEVSAVLLLFLLTRSIIMPGIALIIMHPLFIYITKKDPMFVDIYISNLSNPKELWF